MRKRLAAWFGAGPKAEAGANPPELPLDLSEAAFLADPYPVYDHLRRHHPVAPVRSGGVLLTRHADVLAALSDARLGNAPSRFSALHPRQAQTHLAAAMAGRLPPFLDLPAHRLPRQATSRAFARAFDGWEPVLRDLAQATIAAAPAGVTLDLMADLAAPFAATAMARFLGLPLTPAQVQAYSAAFFRLFAPINDAATFRQMQDTLADARQTLAALIEAGPAPGFVAELLALRADPPDLTADHVIDLTLLVLADGVENIAPGAATILTLWSQQPQGGPEGSTEMAAWLAEALRLRTPAQIIPRIARETLTLHGQTIAADMPVFLALGSANRDPDAFADPDRFDPQRAGDAQALSFGLGRHRCIGERLGLALFGAVLTALRARPAQVQAAEGSQARFGHLWPARCALRFTA